MDHSEFLALPEIVRDYVTYTETVKGRSGHTVDEYVSDLKTFFRYIKLYRGIVSADTEFNEIAINDIDAKFLRSVTLSEVYEFLVFCKNERNNNSLTRARKSSSLRSFFKYLTVKRNILDVNPIDQLDSPKSKKTLPKYLTLEQSIDLLNSVSGDYKERDYCILTLFLNCGFRLSELCGLNVTDVRSDNSIRVLGKGNKERIVYLNDACVDAINNYLKVRPDYEEPNGVKPLFLSKRKKRISPKTVQYTVKKYIKIAELDPTKYSTHKLRHTAATLMYTVGDVDIRSLQEILGHESVATTEIYTHVNNNRLKDAINKNPLADYKKDNQ